MLFSILPVRGGGSWCVAVGYEVINLSNRLLLEVPFPQKIGLDILFYAPYRQLEQFEVIPL